MGDIQKTFGLNIPVYKYQSEEIDAKLDMDFVGIADMQTFECEGATLIAHYAPGHCDDHIVFELKEENGIFCGDCILGEGSTVFTDLYLYMLSLQKLLSFECDVMFPGHGPMIKSAQKQINDYIEHRNEREQQIVNALKMNDGAIDSWALCDIVYSKTP